MKKSVIVVLFLLNNFNAFAGLKPICIYYGNPNWNIYNPTQYGFFDPATLISLKSKVAGTMASLDKSKVYLCYSDAFRTMVMPVLGVDAIGASQLSHCSPQVSPQNTCVFVPR